jgi:hypothetical protein
MDYYMKLKGKKTFVMAKILRNKTLVVLSLFLVLGIYLRFWPIRLFNWISDYDEGAYSVGARLISEGKIPYRDFTLVHPPLYDLILSEIYKIFGYDFFYGRYFSILLFIGCVILAFLIVKKLYNQTAGLISAVFFVTFPGLSTGWYRVVQEPLGIFLILLGIWFLLDYVVGKDNVKKMFLGGMFLGLAIVTKYTFIPAVFAIIVALVVSRIEGRPWPFAKLVSTLLNQKVLVVALGIVLAIFVVIGFFLIVTPNEFLNQTIISQLGYRIGGTYEAIARRALALANGTLSDKIGSYSLLVPLTSAVILLVRRRFTGKDGFITALLLVTLPFSMLFKPFGEYRYFACPFIFSLIAVASMAKINTNFLIREKLNLRVVNKIAGPTVVLALTLIFISGSVLMLRNYNFVGIGKITYESIAYEDTGHFLIQHNDKTLYALNPIIPALYPSISVSQEFDTFGLLEVVKISPKEVIVAQREQGVDYIAVDAFAWIMGIFQGTMFEFVQEIHENGVIIYESVPNGLSIFKIVIYDINYSLIP